MRYLVCIIRGLLWLLEAILKFINRNAYIMISVKGGSAGTARCTERPAAGWLNGCLSVAARMLLPACSVTCTLLQGRQ